MARAKSNVIIKVTRASTFIDFDVLALKSSMGIGFSVLQTRHLTSINSPARIACSPRVSKRVLAVISSLQFTQSVNIFT